MRTSKPQQLGVLHRTFEHGGRKLFVPTVMLAFPLVRPSTVLHEVVVWKAVASEVPDGVIFDEMMFKPRAEVLLAGKAHPPGGSATTCTVRLQLGAIDKTIHVVGDRHWTTTGPSKPRAFSEMSLDWSRAFGGSQHLDNPLGRGAEDVLIDGQLRQPLPNLEIPGRLVTSPGDRPPPISFGPIPFQFAQRQALTGTYDETWRRERYPGFPDDYDPELFNVAAHDQRLAGYLQGGEPFTLENLHPQHSRLEGELPRHRARCFVVRRGAEDVAAAMEEVTMRADTVFFLPAAGLGVLFFRGVIPVEEDDAADVTHLLAGAESPEAPKPLEHYREVWRRRLDPDQGVFAALQDEELLPPREHEASLEVETFDDTAALLATKGHAEANQRRAAERRLADAHRNHRDLGLDPSDLPATLPEPNPPPRLDNLGTAIAKLERDQQDALAEAERRRDSLLARMRAELDQQGIAEGAGEPNRGPPAFRAEAQLQSLRSLVSLRAVGGIDDDGLAAQLEDPAFVARLHRAEAQLLASYKETVQYGSPWTASAEKTASSRETFERARAEGQDLRGLDLTGVNLVAADLRGLDLRDALMESADLSGAKLDGSRLDGAVLAHANLSRAQLTGASLRAANLGGARLDDAVLDDADVEEAIFVRARLLGTSLARTRLSGVDFFETIFERVNMAGAVAHQLLFHQQTLDHLDGSGATLTETLFVDCSLEQARFDGATLTGTAFVGCRGAGLSLADVSGQQLRMVHACHFPGARLAGALLDQAGLRETHFVGADLSRASLKQADLSACDLTDAKLPRIHARGALMMKAILHRAQLSEANLMEALLTKADIRGANLRGANLFRADFARILGDEATRLDGALRTQLRFIRPEGGMSQ